MNVFTCVITNGHDCDCSIPTVQCASSVTGHTTDKFIINRIKRHLTYIPILTKRRTKNQKAFNLYSYFDEKTHDDIANYMQYLQKYLPPLTTTVQCSFPSSSSQLWSEKLPQGLELPIMFSFCILSQNWASSKKLQFAFAKMILYFLMPCFYFSLLMLVS